MAGSETCTEYLITAEKRRISPPENSPNTKRRISPPSDPSLITQLVYDPAIMEMAHNLAGDLGFVQMAKELLSSLQCAGAEHLVSLPIWHNQQLLNTLQQYQPLPTTKETSPREDQHIEERMARIMDHPSLKLLLGEKEDFSMMRGAIIILLAYWIDFDNEDETMEDVIWNDREDVSDSEVYESIINDLIEHPYIENTAARVESGSGLGNILEDLLNSVLQPRPSLDEDCKEHFKIVKMAWEDSQLISFLLKEESVIYKIERCVNVSNQQLLEALTPLIKTHPSMKDILRESKASSVRGVLTLLIGYWSAKNNILGFDDVLGHGGDVGIDTVSYSYKGDDRKVEPTSTCEGGAFVEPSSSYTLDALLPDPSLIKQLLDDASFQDVAQQIQCEPLVEYTDFIWECLTKKPDERFIPSYVDEEVLNIWQDPSLIYLRRALKKSPSLFNLFKKLSDGAQTLRLKERLDRIRGDHFWKTTGLQKSDFSLRMRVALTILIGYWSAADVNRIAMIILLYQLENPSKSLDWELEDLKDVERICYWADSNHDLEGLKNVLARKYAKDSPEFERRVVEIGKQQKHRVDEAVVGGYDNTEAQITALMKGDNCILMLFAWFSETCGRSDFIFKGG